jgi:hypothetical protein
MYDDYIETHERAFDLEAPLEFANLNNKTLVGVGAQLGGPICHISKVPSLHLILLYFFHVVNVSCKVYISLNI